MAAQQSLEDFRDLLKFHVLDDKKVLPTFFELSGYPHYEDVLSNIYKFFLDPTENHGLGHLFLYSLIALIDEKEVENDFDTTGFEDPDLLVERELRSDKGGSIDLVLFNKPQQEHATSAIIIENKVHAALNNDLDDYYDSVKVPSKIGIILSLESIDVGRLNLATTSKFINITHYDWAQELKGQLGQYLQDSHERYLILLKDLIQNIETMSKPPQALSENVKFYFENAPKIERLIELKREAEQFLYEKVRTVIMENDWTNLRLNKNTISFKNKAQSIVGYLYFDKCFGEERKVKLEFWVNGPESVTTWKQNKVAAQITKEFPDIANNINLREQTQGVEWVCFAHREYPIEHLEDLEGLDELIDLELGQTWKPVIGLAERLMK